MADKLYEIKNRWTGEVLFSLECGSLKLCLEAAVKSGADLRGADLRGADLRGADLRDAYLSGADLSGADLRDAYLSGAKIADDITINQTPIQIYGLYYFVTIFDEHMKIGCEFHSLTNWFSYDEKRITEMDGKNALSFWRQWKEPLKTICIADGRYQSEQEKAD